MKLMLLKLAISVDSIFEILVCLCGDGPWKNFTGIVSSLLLPSQVAIVDYCTSLFKVSLGGRG